MPVDPDQVDAFAASVADIYREAETALAQLIARHLRAGLDSPAAEQRLGDVQALRRGAQAIIAALEADSSPAIRDALAGAYRHGWTAAIADLPERWMPRSGIGQAARAALERMPGFGMVEALASALTRDFGALHSNILRNVMDAYRSVQAAAAARVLTGTQTRRQAAQAAWQAWVDQGITSFRDSAGRRWRLSSYAEMSVRTNAQRAATTAQTDRLTSIGVELVYVSDAPQECKLCRPFEGKILRTTAGPLEVQVEHPTRDGVMTTVEAAAALDDARAKGLFHPNCRHSISAYLPGVSRPKGTPDPKGDEARQRQRYIERQIRKYKERADSALTPEAAAAARKKVRAWQGEMRAHLDANPKLKRLRYREQPGAGSAPPRDGTDPAGRLGGPDQPTLDGGPAAPAPASTRRTPAPEQPADADRTPGPDQPVLEAPPRLDDLTALPDEQLEARLAAEMSRPDFDNAELERLAREIDRRDTERQAREAARQRDRERAARRRERLEAERADRMAELLDAGWDEAEAVAEVYGISVVQQQRRRAIADLREQGYAGRGFEELARASYKDYLYRQWLQAEQDTRGNMVTREATARGIDHASLFSGPEARARRWASDELKAWWDRHGRMTFAEWRAQLLDQSGEARRQRERGGGDFLT